MDAAIVALAERQHRVVARWQLLDLGIGRGAIEHRLKAGRLHPIHRGVYAVGTPSLSRFGRWMAAVLANGPHAVLSHRPAGVNWQMLGSYSGLPEVTVPERHGPRPRMRIYGAALPPDETTVHDGIPTTTPERTLLDLAAVLNAQRLERALHEADVHRLLTDGVAVLLDRHPHARGAAILRQILASTDEPALTRNDFETDFLTFIAQFDLPKPKTNHYIGPYEVDAAWPEQRLIVELDGHQVHGTRRSFEEDRLRDRTLTKNGWRVVRITHRQLTESPHDLAKDLADLLSAPFAVAPLPFAVPTGG